MPPDDDQQGAPGTEGDGDAIDDAIAAGAPDLSRSPADVRKSPEFIALAKENRKLARRAGTAETAAAAARAEAETARQAAEAQQQAALEADIMQALGEEGVAFWDEFSQLSVSDPRAAARRLAEALSTARAQNPAGEGNGEGDGGAPAGGDEGVPAQTPPPPSRGVDGSAPLGAAASGEDIAQVIAGLETTYQGVVERIQDPVTRNRVTMRDRAAGFIAYVAGAYLKAGATPKDQRR